MAESDLLHVLRIAKLFLTMTTCPDVRAELRGVVGECSSQIHRHRQRTAAKRRNDK